MNGCEKNDHQAYIPPPSYEQAVHGQTPPQATASPPTYTSYPYSQNRSQHHTSVLPSYDTCPAGTEALREHHEILIYSQAGHKYKIKDSNKETIMTAKKHSGDCCDCCTCQDPTKFSLYSQQDATVAEAISVMDAFNCCSHSPQHMDVMAPVGVSLGTVFVKSSTYCVIVNQSGDQLFYLKREQDCGCYSPYEIFTPGGSQVGSLDNSRGNKNRLTLPRDLPVRHKILLLFFAMYMQKEEDDQRDS